MASCLLFQVSNTEGTVFEGGPFVSYNSKVQKHGDSLTPNFHQEDNLTWQLYEKSS